MGRTPCAHPAGKQDCRCDPAPGPGEPRHPGGVVAACPQAAHREVPAAHRAAGAPGPALSPAAANPLVSRLIRSCCSVLMLLIKGCLSAPLSSSPGAFCSLPFAVFRAGSLPSRRAVAPPAPRQPPADVVMLPQHAGTKLAPRQGPSPAPC